MAKGKAAKRAKKLTARRQPVKDLDTPKARSVKGGVISRGPSTVKLS
jgi:hypothetical protein